MVMRVKGAHLQKNKREMRKRITNLPAYSVIHLRNGSYTTCHLRNNAPASTGIIIWISFHGAELLSNRIITLIYWYKFLGPASSTSSSHAAGQADTHISCLKRAHFHYQWAFQTMCCTSARLFSSTVMCFCGSSYFPPPQSFYHPPLHHPTYATWNVCRCCCSCWCLFGLQRGGWAMMVGQSRTRSGCKYECFHMWTRIDFAYLHEQVLLGNCHRTSWSYPIRPTLHCNCIGAHSSVPLLIRDAENEILNQLLRQIEPQRHLVSSFASLHIHRIIFPERLRHVLNLRENCDSWYLLEQVIQGVCRGSRRGSTFDFWALNRSSWNFEGENEEEEGGDEEAGLSVLH